MQHKELLGKIRKKKRRKICIGVILILIALAPIGVDAYLKGYVKEILSALGIVGAVCIGTILIASE